MMVVDASAILAILFDEDEAGSFAALLAEAANPLISPVNLWEVMVRARSARGAPGVEAAETLVDALELRIEPIDAEQTYIAVEAAVRYGRGTPAALNLGDCFAYALARSKGCGLLFKGEDFKRTDVERVPI